MQKHTHPSSLSTTHRTRRAAFFFVMTLSVAFFVATLLTPSMGYFLKSDVTITTSSSGTTSPSSSSATTTSAVPATVTSGDVRPDCDASNCFFLPTQPAAWGGIVRDTTLIPAFQRWINFALGFLGLVGTLVMLYFSMLYVTSRGEDEQAEAAKKGIIFVAVGILVLMLAYAAVNTLIETGSTTTSTIITR